MPELCDHPNCNLMKGHKGAHKFVVKKSWEDFFNKTDIDKINKAGYSTPRGGAKGAYQNHVYRNGRVIIPYEKLGIVDLSNYKDGYIISIFPQQYFKEKWVVKDEFLNNDDIIVGQNAFILYRTYDDFEKYPPLDSWNLRSLVKKDKKTGGFIATKRRGKGVEDRGEYVLRLPPRKIGEKSVEKGAPQGIFAPEYADENTNFLCQAVLAWLIINTLDSPYDKNKFEHLKLILDRYDLLDSSHYAEGYIMVDGVTCCPLCNKKINYKELSEQISFEDEEGLSNSTIQIEGATRSTKVNLFHMVPLCYETLENVPKQVAWGHATCNTRLGQRRCYSYKEVKMGKRLVAEDGETLGYATNDLKFIRSKNGNVWIKISSDSK